MSGDNPLADLSLIGGRLSLDFVNTVDTHDTPVGDKLNGYSDLLWWALRVGMLAAVLYGSLRAAANAWTLGDIGVGLMSWLNIVAILILQKPAMQALKDYEAQKKAGKDPTFDPGALGIKNATLWSERGR
jgi:hypothetical protein